MPVRRSSLFGIAMAATLAIALPAPAIAGPAEDYAAIERDYESWLLRESPEYASALGVRAYDGRISDISLAAMDRRAAEAAAMLARLDSVPADALTPALRTNRAIMHRQLSETVEGNRYPQRMMLFTTYAGWHQSYAGLANSSPFSNAADYRSYLDRLAQYPVLSDEAVSITARGVSEGHVLPCVVLGNIERSVAGLITETPEASR
ncbi:MAG: DUF885 family protein, partial [Sphingopyxis sp.]|nr:DUF885 family protein [Sphingopyxis sp.]